MSATVDNKMQLEKGFGNAFVWSKENRRLNFNFDKFENHFKGTISQERHFNDMGL